MPIPNDDLRFETELKRFRPRAAGPLPALSGKPALVTTRRGTLAAALAMTALLAGAIVWYARRQSPSHAKLQQPPGVTLGYADAALAQGGDFAQTIDKLERVSRPKGQQRSQHATRSAFAVLGEEEE